MKEADDASKERLQSLRQEMADLRREPNVQKAGWLNQKNAIDRVQELKGKLDEAQRRGRARYARWRLGARKRAALHGDSGLGARHAQLPEAELDEQKERGGGLQQGDFRRDRRGGERMGRSTVSKMMQGELEKLSISRKSCISA